MPADRSILQGFDAVIRLLEEPGKCYFDANRVTIEPLNSMDLPFSRLLRARVLSTARSWYVFIKVYKSPDRSPGSLQSVQQKVASEFATLAKVRESMAGYPGLSAARPIACFPEYLAIVTEEAPGKTIHHHLNRPVVWPLAKGSVRELTAAFERVGLWVKVFQQTGDASGRVCREDLRSYLDERLRILLRNRAAEFTPKNRDAALRYFDALCREVSDAELSAVRVHGDFCPHNVLTSGSNLTVLDFSTTRTGSLYDDLAHMFMHVENHKARPWMGPRIISRIQTAMLRAFDPALESARPLFRLMLLRHVVCRFVQMSVTPVSPVLRLYRGYLWAHYWTWLQTL